MKNLKNQLQIKHFFWIILLFAIGVRILGIASRPIWYDEAIAILSASESPRAMVHGTLAPDMSGNAANVHPLLYYFFLWGWMWLWNDGIVVVRILSILISLGAVVFAYAISRDLFDERMAMLAMFLMALSPFQIHYSQEIRMYALMSTLLLGSAWFCIRGTIAIEQGRIKYSLIWWVFFAIFAALAQYTHNLSVFFLAALFFTPILWRNWRASIAILAASLLAMLLYAPWLVQLFRQLDKVSTSYWVEVPALSRFLTTILVFVSNLPLLGVSFIIGLFSAIFVFILAVWQTIRSIREDIPRKRYWLWLVYMSFAPVLTMFLVSQWIPVYIERALLTSGAIFLLWIAWVLTKTNLPILIRNTTFAILLSGMLVGIFMHVTYSGFPYGPYSALNAYINGRMESADIVVHSNKLTMLPMYYDNRVLPHRFVRDNPNSGSDTLALPTQEMLGLFADETILTATDKADRVWFIIFDKAIEEYLDAGYINHPHLTWLNENYTETAKEKWGSIWLYIYER
jgi:uncharacterized membrane protein